MEIDPTIEYFSLCQKMADPGRRDIQVGDRVVLGKRGGELPVIYSVQNISPRGISIGNGEIIKTVISNLAPDREDYPWRVEGENLASSGTQEPGNQRYIISFEPSAEPGDPECQYYQENITEFLERLDEGPDEARDAVSEFMSVITGGIPEKCFYLLDQMIPQFPHLIERGEGEFEGDDEYVTIGRLVSDYLAYFDEVSLDPDPPWIPEAILWASRRGFYEIQKEEDPYGPRGAELYLIIEAGNKEILHNYAMYGIYPYVGTYSHMLHKMKFNIIECGARETEARKAFDGMKYVAELTDPRIFTQDPRTPNELAKIEKIIPRFPEQYQKDVRDILEILRFKSSPLVKASRFR